MIVVSRYRPPWDTPERLAFKSRLTAAYHAEREFLLNVEYLMWRNAAVLEVGSPTLLYVVAEGFDAVKIGIATKPEERLSTLQVGNPRPLTLIAATPATLALERFIHERLHEDRITGEWFAGTDRVFAVAELIVSAAEQCDDCEDNGGEVDAGFSIGAMTAFIDEAARRAA